MRPLRQTITKVPKKQRRVYVIKSSFTLENFNKPHDQIWTAPQILLATQIENRKKCISNAFHQWIKCPEKIESTDQMFGVQNHIAKKDEISVTLWYLVRRRFCDTKLCGAFDLGFST